VSGQADATAPDAEAFLAGARRSARAARCALGSVEQAAAARSVLAQVVASPWWGPARVVAGTVAADGEVDPGPLLARARAEGRTVVLAAMEGGAMVFRVDEGERVTDAMGLVGPPPSAPAVDPRSLDLVLVPLVLVDRTGARAGRGGGHYDRAFAFRRHQPPPPRLVGLAHACQVLARVPVRAHDVRLDAVAIAGEERILVPGLPARPGGEG
jgi:5-formyltetrahydrofolate cyclo-ligase